MLSSVLRTSSGSTAAITASLRSTMPCSRFVASAMPVEALEIWSTSFATSSEFCASAPVKLAHVAHRLRDVVGIVGDHLLDRLQRLVGAREDGARAGQQILHAGARGAMMVGSGIASQIGGSVGEPPAIST